MLNWFIKWQVSCTTQISTHVEHTDYLGHPRKCNYQNLK